jgi:hypothetical protein
LRLGGRFRQRPWAPDRFRFRLGVAAGVPVVEKRSLESSILPSMPDVDLWKRISRSVPESLPSIDCVAFGLRLGATFLSARRVIAGPDADVGRGGSAQALDLRGHKDRLFAYPGILSVAEDGTFFVVDYDKMRDIHRRDRNRNGACVRLTCRSGVRKYSRVAVHEANGRKIETGVTGDYARARLFRDLRARAGR